MSAKFSSIVKLCNSNERGVTLIELLAAMTILSILVLSFAAISQYTLHQSSKNQREASALAVAQAKMDELTALIQQSIPAVGSFNGMETWVEDSTFQIYVEDLPLTGPVTTPWERDQLVLQSIVTMSDSGQDVPRLLTVTVYWGG